MHITRTITALISLPLSTTAFLLFYQEQCGEQESSQEFPEAWVVAPSRPPVGNPTPFTSPVDYR